MRFLAILLLVTFTNQAHAADDKDKVCKLVSTYSPAQNVVYQAGVDVNGNPVVGADLNTSPMNEALNIIKVPLNVDLAQRVARLTGQGIEMNAPLGMLEIQQNGKITYNGEDWTKPVMTLCGQSFKEVTVNEIMVPTETIQNIEPAAQPAVDEIQLLRQEVEALKEELAIKKADDAIAIPTVSPPTEATMPSVQAPTVQMLDEVTPTKERMKNMNRAKVSSPAKPIQPLIGIPRKIETEPEIIKGQDYRDYNE